MRIVKASVLLVACTAIAATVTAGEIRHDLVADVSAERIEADIRKLVGFGTRHTLSETESDTRGIGAARRWIADEYRKISEECGGQRRRDPAWRAGPRSYGNDVGRHRFASQ